MTTARDIMTSEPASVLATDTIGYAIETLQALEVRHLPVVNEARELVGILSDRDLRALSRTYLTASNETHRQHTLDRPVAALMTGDVLAVESEASVAEIVALMLEHKIGAVPVTDADGALIGIVSYVDVLRSISFE
jgi:acetoin utilization protein AcuB